MHILVGYTYCPCYHNRTHFAIPPSRLCPSSSLYSHPLHFDLRSSNYMDCIPNLVAGLVRRHWFMIVHFLWSLVPRNYLNCANTSSHIIQSVFYKSKITFPVHHTKPSTSDQPSMNIEIVRSSYRTAQQYWSTSTHSVNLNFLCRAF